MEFVCGISSRDYRAGRRLKRKNLQRVVLAVLLFDAVLWAFWMVLAIQGNIVRASAIFSQALIFLSWPVFCLLVFAWSDWYGYKRNRNIQSEFTYTVSAEGIGYKSSSGGSGQTPWSSIGYWRESKDVFILVFPSGGFLIYPKQGMTVGQREEFAGIAARALPRK